MITNPIYQNPLAGGALSRPQDNQLQGDALVERMQMRMTQRDQKTPAFLAYFKDVMDTKGYPTKTMQEYESQLPEYIPQQVPLGVNISNANFNTSPPGMLNVTPPSVPVSEQTPMSGDNSIASTQQIPDAGLFNRVGQQLIGYDDQFSGINDRLNKIEEGIASLVQNRGQGLNMNTGGLGYFFNPFRGFYG